MTLKEYFELEDQLREAEKTLEYNYGTYLNREHYSKEINDKVKENIRVGKEKVKLLKEKVIKARLELGG